MNAGMSPVLKHYGAGSAGCKQGCTQMKGVRYEDMAMTGREYLESIMPTREMVDHFVTPVRADVPAEFGEDYV